MKQDFSLVAQEYIKERENCSFNALVLDGYLENILRCCRPGKCLDYGAGIGTVSKIATAVGLDVTAFEPDPSMFRLLKAILQDESMTIANSQSQLKGRYDVILSINMLDYVDNLDEILSYFYRILDSTGQLILSVPHPMKDLGDWVKVRSGTRWDYLYYRLDGYLEEKLCHKPRENVNGDVIQSGVHSYHRTISTYYNAIFQAGFTVTHLGEPGVSPKAKDYPIIQQKASRIPYFLVFVCKKR